MDQAQPTAAVRILEFVERGSGKGVRYALSADDYATLARAVEFEGSPQTAVAWTLIQRFAYVFPTYRTLKDLVSAYCQPINPAWFPGGRALVPYVQQLRAAGKLAQAAAEEVRAKRRVWQSSYPIDKLSPRTTNALAQVFWSGAASPIPGSIHFRAPTVVTNDMDVAAEARKEFATKHRLLDSIRVGDPRTDNWFFAEPGSVSYQVRTIVEQTAAILGAIALISAVAIWLAMKGA